MQLSWDEIQANAIRFSKRWETARREKADEQPFLLELLGVFGVEDPVKVGERQKEVKVKGETTKWIDYFWKDKIAVEMKSKGENLAKAYEQLRDRYMAKIDPQDLPDLWLICDFENFHLWRVSTKEVTRFKLKDLRRHIKKFASIAGYETEQGRGEQIEVNVKAAGKMTKLYHALKELGYDGYELEVYLVRLLFCLFADDTAIFPKDHLYSYIEKSKTDGSDLSHRIADLFEVLNMPDDVRAKKTMLSGELRKFRYINGNLFSLRLPPADFNAKMRQILLECLDFDWNRISPAIFGAMFQGVMDDTKRREMGAHYTSEENIEKLINPLFMDELYGEFERVKTDPTALDRFHEKVAKLKFLDPACGCGNFLIVTYTKLRELELEILKMKVSTRQGVIDISDMLKVSVEQFYGIECEEFPCQIAQVGMWLADHQMNLRASEQFGDYFARLPLTHGATIVHGNALRLDWEEVVPKNGLSYILGNPPFVGHQYRTAEQKKDMEIVYRGIPKTETNCPVGAASCQPHQTDSANLFLKEFSKNFGKLDYVCCWYKKAAEYMAKSPVRAAFVSTNSIVQGESVAAMWKPLFEQGIEITFAHTSFIWSNEAKGKAAVYCVIVGFAGKGSVSKKRIFDEDSVTETDNINGYLIGAPNVFIRSRGKPLTAGMPEMSKGSQPTDGGNLILSIEEREELIGRYPQAEKWVKRYMMGDDFINNGLRYCLWLKGVLPTEFRSIKPIMQRLEKVAEGRRQSPTASVQRDADTPMLFTQIRQPDAEFLVVPKVSSIRRRYIPMDFLSPDVIVGDMIQFIEGATLYMFGILTSNVHMAWVRAVAGRLKSDYRYSPAVYNNFPWPGVNENEKKSVEILAQTVLGARKNYEGASLADLYDPLSMPPDLLKAHRSLDAAVMKLYGFPVKKEFTEADCVARLMEMYKALAGRG